MKDIRAFLLLGLGALGLLCGYAGNRLLNGRTSPASLSAPAQTARASGSAVDSADARQPKSMLPPVAKIRSTDTLESLATADAESLYGRLAAWLMDASEPEIAEYWASVKDKPRTNDITDLIFVHWTRLDPQAAIAAVAGTGSEHYAWWAWSCHDPEGALAAAIAANPDRVNNVAWGIGEFHPEWLLKHFDEIPESGRRNAISGLTKWDDAEKPLEVLNFLKQHGGEFNPAIFKTLVRKDPWAAIDWMRDNKDMILRNYGSEESENKMLVETLAESRPDALERLAAQTPSGELKRRMEAALFGKLLETDPAAALEQANATQAPVIAAQRLAAVGIHQLEGDPDQAFDIARKMFSSNPACLRQRTVIQGPNGDRSTSFGHNEDVSEFVTALMAKDPARVMDMLPPPTAEFAADFSSLASNWADQDLAAYSDWVKQQKDPAVRDSATLPVVHELMQSQQFAEAAEWAMGSAAAKPYLTDLFREWQRSNPDEARQWLESADLPAEDKARHLQNLKNNP